MRGKLILLNGTPGIGKSTLARRYVDDHPLALNLDIDGVRAALGRWEEDAASKQLARALALAMARTHLLAGHDVVVPQLLGRVEFIDQLAGVARKAGASFHEIVLVDSPAASLARFRARRAELEAAGKPHPQQEIASADEVEAIRSTRDSLLRRAADRPWCTVIATRAGAVDDAYRAVLDAVDSRGDGLVIAPDDPRAEDVAALLTTHLSFAHTVTPAGHVHALDVDALVDPAVTFFSARRDGQLLGVGALKTLDPAHGEVKSMHVSERARGGGVGRAIIDHLLVVARQRGFERVSLETGTMDVFAPARRLYAAAGFVPCEPFADYTVNPYSTCMTIDLRAAGDQ